jgi:hypothetical protein
MEELIQARATELQAMPWTGIREAAENVGFMDKPDEDLSWKDNALNIAQREYQLGRLEPPVIEATETHSPEPALVLSEPEQPLVKGRYRTDFYKAAGIPYCPLCGEKELSDSQNNPLCPENFSADICPRKEQD